jgi:hypothetical protein
LENRADKKILYFPFKTTKPIFGCFLEKNTVAINSRIFAPPHIKLFIALHESKHCDQYEEGRFYYFEPVLYNDLPDFLKNYTELEKEANEYAINTLKILGFQKEMRNEERTLRSNENMGNLIFNMMKNDTEVLKAKDMFDLLRKQIL